MEDVFAIQDEISLAVVEALKLRLLGEEKKKVVKRHTESFKAYRAYLKGRYHWFIRSSSDIEKAIEYLKEAVAIDPEYALAYAGLADCYGVLPMYRPVAPEEIYPKAKAAALRALELHDSLAEALEMIPEESFRAWVAVLLRAAQDRQDPHAFSSQAVAVARAALAARDRFTSFMISNATRYAPAPPST